MGCQSSACAAKVHCHRESSDTQELAAIAKQVFPRAASPAEKARVEAEVTIDQCREAFRKATQERARAKQDLKQAIPRVVRSSPENFVYGEDHLKNFNSMKCSPVWRQPIPMPPDHVMTENYILKLNKFLQTVEDNKEVFEMAVLGAREALFHSDGDDPMVEDVSSESRTRNLDASMFASNDSRARNLDASTFASNDSRVRNHRRDAPMFPSNRASMDTRVRYSKEAQSRSGGMDASTYASSESCTRSGLDASTFASGVSLSGTTDLSEERPEGRMLMRL
mmetsp:Transcript_32296/g.73850  ORF Transcript_32296/g.73850 Transcript_32296/m.73850 type:complete len:280 (+) Transcript_32296:52-891(+)